MTDKQNAEQLARQKLEQLVRQALDSGQPKIACSEAIQGYGPEVYGFIVSLTRETELAEEAFSIMCEDVWRGIAEFRWQSSLRTWIYAVARHACYRAKRGRLRSRLELGKPELDEIEAQVRSATATFLRTETKSAVRDLRDQLSDEENELLILRIDRGMSWAEIAQVTLESAPPNPELLRQQAALCRKRFERAKNKLKALAIREGLIRDDK